MDIKETLKDTVSIEEVINKLGGLGLNRMGGALLGPCPTGHASEGNKCFGVNLRQNFYNCFHCGEAGDIFNLVMMVNKVDFLGALRWITQEFRQDLVPKLDQYQGEVNPAIKEYYQKASIYDLAYKYGKSLLFEPEGKEALDYLINQRGYTLENIKQTDWIYYPPEQDIREYILNQQPEAKGELGKVNLQGHYGDKFRLAFPYRDRRGSITGFVKRALDPAGIKIPRQDKGVRYDSTAGLSKADLFNLYSCRKQQTLIIVEGYPDALYLPSLGVNNIVAVGQGLLAKSHIEGLQAFGVKRVILALDNEETGLRNTEAALNLLKGTGINAFVIDHNKMGSYKDPDELVKGQGIEAFKALIDDAQAAAKWKARRLLGKYPKTDIGQDLILGEALEYSDNLDDLIEAKQFIETIAEGLGLDYKELEPRLLDHQQRQDKIKQDQVLKKVLAQAEDLRREGKPGAAIDLLKSSQQDLAPSRVTKEVIRPYTLQDLTKDIEDTQPGLKTGYKDLDNLVTIPQDAITIIAGRPSHGKTTMLLNLLIRMAHQYPDKTFLYFSYEETRKQLGIKLLNILSQDVINEAQNLASLEGYLRGGHISRPLIEEGKTRLEEFLNTGRVWLIDKPLFVDELEAVITDMANRYAVGAVFIDYIQKVRIKGKHGTRQLEIQAISANLLDMAQSIRLPIILGAQFGRKDGKTATLKLDNLREAGDIEQDTNLVIGLWNDAMAKAEDMNQKVKDRKVNLELTILKQRNAAPNETVNLTFDPPVLTITDKQ